MGRANEPEFHGASPPCQRRDRNSVDHCQTKQRAHPKSFVSLTGVESSVRHSPCPARKSVENRSTGTPLPSYKLRPHPKPTIKRSGSATIMKSKPPACGMVPPRGHASRGLTAASIHVYDESQELDQTERLVAGRGRNVDHDDQSAGHIPAPSRRRPLGALGPSGSNRKMGALS